MITLLARLLAALTLLSIALVGVTLLAGGLTPSNERDWLLSTNPCALPCVFGVVPRITTRDDAMKAFENTVLRTTALNALPTYAERGSAGTQSLLALLDLTNPDLIVRSVLLYQMEGGSDLGMLSDYLLAGYQPTRVFSECANVERLIVILDEAGLFIQVSPVAAGNTDAAVQLFGSTGGGDGMPRALDTFGCTVQTEWSGMAALWRRTA